MTLGHSSQGIVSCPLCPLCPGTIAWLIRVNSLFICKHRDQGPRSGGRPVPGTLSQCGRWSDFDTRTLSAIIGCRLSVPAKGITTLIPSEIGDGRGHSARGSPVQDKERPSSESFGRRSFPQSLLPSEYHLLVILPPSLPDLQKRLPEVAHPESPFTDPLFSPRDWGKSGQVELMESLYHNSHSQ